MLNRTVPEIGCWYENPELGCLFEVVSLDEDDHSIAIQYYEGEIEALELEEFQQMPLRRVQQPEDWGGPFELDLDDRYESDFMNNPDESAELQHLDDGDNLHIEQEDFY